MEYMEKVDLVELMVALMVHPLPIAETADYMVVVGLELMARPSMEMEDLVLSELFGALEDRFQLLSLMTNNT